MMTPPSDETHLENGKALSTALPHPDGFFGDDKTYGGAFLPPPLVAIMKNVSDEYDKFKEDPEFLAELSTLRKQFTGRPSPIYHCKNLSNKIGGAQIYLKREDLNHTGSHKINHCLGQALLARKMNKTKLIAETGAGQHGVALATTAALVQMECEIHMGEIDIKKEWPNVRRMQVLGAKVVPATHGGKSLKEAVDSACKYNVCGLARFCFNRFKRFNPSDHGTA
jgi:tryptophan synthase beta chain